MIGDIQSFRNERRESLAPVEARQTRTSHDGPLSRTSFLGPGPEVCVPIFHEESVSCTSIFSIACPIAVRFKKRLKVSTSGSSGMISLCCDLSSRRRKYGHIYNPASPRPAGDTRAGVSGIPGSRRHEQVASAERIHWKGSPHGCQGRRDT